MLLSVICWCAYYKRKTSKIQPSVQHHHVSCAFAVVILPLERCEYMIFNFILNDDVLHHPLFAEHGKTSMVWWMLAADVRPLTQRTSARVRTVATLVKSEKTSSCLMLSHANVVCLWSWCAGVCICDVLRDDESLEGYLHVDCHCVTWRREQRQEDHSFFVSNWKWTEKPVNRTKPKREICVIFNQPEKNEASNFFLIFLFFFLMQVVTSVNLPPEGGHVTGVCWSGH